FYFIVLLGALGLQPFTQFFIQGIARKRDDQLLFGRYVIESNLVFPLFNHRLPEMSCRRIPRWLIAIEQRLAVAVVYRLEIKPDLVTVIDDMHARITKCDVIAGISIVINFLYSHVASPLDVINPAIDIKSRARGGRC